MKAFTPRVMDMARKFRILRSWSISACHHKTNSGYSCVSTSKKMLTIYAWHELGNTSKPAEPKDYVFHEVLHGALRALTSMDKRKPKDMILAEEELVQDICNIFREKK